MRKQFEIASACMAVLGVMFLASNATAAYFEPLDTILPSTGVEFGFIEIQNNDIALFNGHGNVNELEIIDFSDPEQLTPMGRMSFSHAVYNPDWKGSFLYIPGGHARENEPNVIYIYNTTDFQNIVLASFNTLSYHYVSCAEVRGSFALIGCDYNGSEGGFYTLSIDDPYNPYVVWNCDTISAFDIILGQTLAYGFTWCSEIKILDISRMDSPVQLTHFYCSEVDAIDVDESRNLLYATSFDQGLLIYDISSPANPVLLSSTQLPDPGSFPVDVCHSKLNHQFLFIAAYYSRLWAIDTTDPVHPVAAAHYNMPQGYSIYICSHADLVFADNHYDMVSLRFHPEGDAVDENRSLPDKICLSQNYPNPFNRSTIISYSLPESRNIRLEIYDALGRKISTLFDDYQQAGEKTVAWDAASFSSGTYFYRLTSPDYVISRTMTVIK